MDNRLLSPYLSAGDNEVKLVITLIGAYGPMLAVMLDSCTIKPKQSGIKGIKRWGIAVQVFLIINMIWWVSTEKFGAFDPNNIALLTSKLVLAFLVAFVISGVFSCISGLGS